MPIPSDPVSRPKPSGINKLKTLALAVETTPQRVDDIGLSGPPPDLRG